MDLPVKSLVRDAVSNPGGPHRSTVFISNVSNTTECNLVWFSGGFIDLFRRDFLVENANKPWEIKPHVHQLWTQQTNDTQLLLLMPLWLTCHSRISIHFMGPHPVFTEQTCNATENCSSATDFHFLCKCSLESNRDYFARPLLSRSDTGLSSTQTRSPPH